MPMVKMPVLMDIRVLPLGRIRRPSGMGLVRILLRERQKVKVWKGLRPSGISLPHQERILWPWVPVKIRRRKEERRPVVANLLPSASRQRSQLPVGLHSGAKPVSRLQMLSLSGALRRLERVRRAGSRSGRRAMSAPQTRWRSAFPAMRLRQMRWLSGTTAAFPRVRQMVLLSGRMPT